MRSLPHYQHLKGCRGFFTDETSVITELLPALEPPGLSVNYGFSLSRLAFRTLTLFQRETFYHREPQIETKPMCWHFRITNLQSLLGKSIRRGSSAPSGGIWDPERSFLLGRPDVPCTSRGANSQVEDQVMVPLLGDAVMEPDCGRSQGSQLQESTLLPPLPSLPSGSNTVISQSLSTSEGPRALTNAVNRGPLTSGAARRTWASRQQATISLFLI